MKNFKKLILAVATAVILGGCAGKSNSEPITGGWTAASDSTITEDLQQMFDEAMQDHLGVDYTPVALLETQLVSGMNYKFLCETQVVALGAEKKTAVVTIYKDLQGNLEVLDIAEQESENVQIPNPIVEMNSLADAEAAAGFSFTVPETLEGYNGRTISCISNEIIQVIYGNDDNNVYVRKARGSDDISGDYNTYESETEGQTDGMNVIYKADAAGIHTAIWTDRDYTYSLTASGALTQEAAEAIISACR